MIFYHNKCYIFAQINLVVGFKFRYPHFNVDHSSTVQQFTALSLNGRIEGTSNKGLSQLCAVPSEFKKMAIRNTIPSTCR